ncbi:DNA methyltransferase [Corynebacterium breve]|uniref:DNA methyltransferase n=1 Tax=Corynebacterium breve TaxID=3049799 RepID=A0ABY8VGD3_9CORY|nr:DNA methyltransferase [Corynebacterium breve]WIM68709.1 DNA methyltransferase [Corynebacterium breve]
MRPDDEDANTYHPFWSHLFAKDVYGTAESANLELKEYFGTKDVFDTVKPVRLIRALLGHMRGVENDTDFTVIDFFSGSATTAEAVLDINAREGLGLKYILVQLDDGIAEDRIARTLGFATIDQIGRERIKRAAAKIKEETGADIDYGFKLFRLDEPSEQTIDQLYEFDPSQGALFEGDYVSKFATDEASGKDVILTTWLNQDGFGLNAKPGQVNLAGYTLDVCEDSAYIIDTGLTSDDVVELVRLIETGELDVSRIVVFGYSVKFNVMHELKKNMNVLKSGRNVTVIERL